MKLIKYIVLLLVFPVFGQTECDHNVSTDYTNPTNSALPIGVEANKYKNGFNWFPITNGLYDDYPCTNISFGGIQYSEMNSILSSPLSAYDYLKKGPLPLTENGWELLIVNVGRYPDDVTPITAGNSLYALPYIVIYNRYSGVVRVFVNFGLDHTVGNGADAMEIELSFVDKEKMSGLFRLNEGADQALDQTSDVVTIRSLCIAAPAFSQHWASTDFKIAYDPCTCFYPSKLRLNIKQLATSSIELHGRSITLEDEPLINNTNLQVKPSEYLTGFDYTGSSVNGGGIVMHKSMEFMINDYLEKYKKYNDELVAVGEHNAKVKKNMALLKLAKLVIGFIAAPPANLIPLNATASQKQVLLAEYAAEIAAHEGDLWTQMDIAKAYEGLGAFDEIGNEIDWFKLFDNGKDAYIAADSAGNKILNTEEIFKGATQIFGEKAKTFIANNFIEKKAPVPPSVPTATFSEMHYTGQLNDHLDIGGPIIYNPGTYESSGTGSPVITNVYEYPVYNEVLGTFALLKSPKIVITESIPTGAETVLSQKVTAYSPGSVYPYDIEMNRYRTWTKEYQIKLTEDLKYAMNSTLDIKNYTVQASFDIVATPKLRQPILGESKLSTFQDPIKNVNVTSNNVDVATNSGIIATNTPYHVHYNNPDFNIDNFTNVSYPINRGAIAIQTPYLPVDAFFPVISGIGIKNEFESYHKHTVAQWEVDNYEINYNMGCDCKLANLNDPDIVKPPDINIYAGGYEYDFKVELKLIVDIEFYTLNEYGQTNKLTQLLTYQVDNITYLSSALVNNLATSTQNIGQYPANIYLDDLDFHGQQVEGCKRVGYTYTCQAWNNVIIDGNITTSPGYKVNIYGGIETSVINESVISPEVVLAVVPVLDFSHPMPKVDQTYVTSFCNSTNGQASPYKANQASAKVVAIMDSLQALAAEQEIINSSWDFELFPNPATQNTTLLINSRSDFQVSIRVVDLTGKSVEVKVRANGEKSHSLDFSNCQKGMYFVTVSTNGGSQTKQLIVQ